MACDITRKLPDEVLAHIFSYLDPLEKVAASSVCKRWMEVFNDCPGLLDDVCVSFTGYVDQDFWVFPSMTRNFRCFRFHKILIDLNVILFLKKFGPKIRSLSFENCSLEIDINDPSYKISNLDNLLELRMFYSGVERLFSFLPKLKSLHFNFILMSFESSLSHVEEITPLSLMDLKIGDPYRDVEHNEVLDVAAFFPTLLPFMHGLYPVVKDFIEKRRSTLRFLDLSGLRIRDEDMAKIFEIEGLRLKRLKLPRHLRLEETFRSFCTSQQGIVALDFERVFLDDASMVMICNALPRMEDLNVSFCKHINKSVVQILQLKCLRRLNLSGCKGIRDVTLLSAFENIACSELNVLDLKYVRIGNMILSLLLTFLPNLRKITLDEGYYLDSSWVECFKNVPSHTQTFLYRPNVW